MIVLRQFSFFRGGGGRELGNLLRDFREGYTVKRSEDLALLILPRWGAAVLDPYEENPRAQSRVAVPPESEPKSIIPSWLKVEEKNPSKDRPLHE